MNESLHVNSCLCVCERDRELELFSNIWPLLPILLSDRLTDSVEAQQTINPPTTVPVMDFNTNKGKTASYF